MPSGSSRGPDIASVMPAAAASARKLKQGQSEARLLYRPSHQLKASRGRGLLAAGRLGWHRRPASPPAPAPHLVDHKKTAFRVLRRRDPIAARRLGVHKLFGRDVGVARQLEVEVLRRLPDLHRRQDLWGAGVGTKPGPGRPKGSGLRGAGDGGGARGSGLPPTRQMALGSWTCTRWAAREGFSAPSAQGQARLVRWLGKPP
jgi:hypothetical protein